MFLSETIRTYLFALKNEIELDVFAHRVMQKVQKSPSPSFVPLRPIQSLKYYRKSPRLFLIFYYGMLAIWPVLSILQSTILCILTLAIWIARYSARRQARESWSHSSDIGINTTHKLSEQLAKIPVTAPIRLLVFTKKEATGDTIYYQDLIRSPLDILQAWACAVISVFVAPAKLDGYVNIFQTYDAFRWFLRHLTVRSAITPQQSIHYANHFDRWAVMCDNIHPCKQRIWIQHGIVGYIHLPYRLKNVDIAYVFGDRYAEIARTCIIDNPNTEYRKFESRIQLTPLSEADSRKQVLLISHPIFVEKEKQFIDRLTANPRIRILTKPHPAYKEYGLPTQETPGYLLVAEKDIYPEVDIVLSYQSTLALEYEIAGIPVMYHDERELQDICIELDEKLGMSHPVKA